MNDANSQWLDRLRQLLQHGARSNPRGKVTAELLHATLCVGLEDSLITIRERKLNYKFAAAEALWIIDGDDRVEPLARFNPRMREFSDDGVVLAGAYGPRLMPQIGYVVDTLLADRDTRQAVATIWTPNPERSRDIPCTIALTFMIRNDLLHCHAFMRSSDVWLGIPYDLFSFSQVALHVLATFNAAARIPAMPGKLWLTAASSHMYEVDMPAAQALLDQGVTVHGSLVALNNGFGISDVRARLERLREYGRGELEL